MPDITTNERVYEVDTRQGTLKIKPRIIEGNQIVAGRTLITISVTEFEKNPDDLIQLGGLLYKMGLALKGA